MATEGRDWNDAGRELAAARLELATAGPGGRQAACDRLVAAQRSLAGSINGWLASRFELTHVDGPTRVLALDVDGVLEIDDGQWSAPTMAGAGALKLLQLGGVAVILNSARSLCEVRARAAQLGLLGGVAALGAATWDQVFGREAGHLSSLAEGQMERLRRALADQDDLVLLGDSRHSVSASRLVRGELAPVPASRARQILDARSLDQLAGLVAGRSTYFVDRIVTKASGLARLRRELGLAGLPLAAMGDSACDLPMLRAAETAFLPAGALRGYRARERQRAVRLGGVAGGALWAAACRLVPDRRLQGRVCEVAERGPLPAWLPPRVRQPITPAPGWGPRLRSLAEGAFRSPRLRPAAKEGS